MDIIQFLYSLIGTPLGYILYFIYKFIPNVGVAIILFTFIVKLALLPLSIKQQKNSAKSAVFQPKVMEIQQKYKNNQQKQQEELMKLQQQGYKPMSGCGSMLLSFLILFGVIDVVYKPLTHIVHMKSDAISAVVEESYAVELTSVIVNEYGKTADDIAKMKEKELTKHEDIIRDSAKLVAYYNEHCLKDGDAAVTAQSVFSTVNSENVGIVETAIKACISDAYSQNNSNTLLNNTDLYRITDEEKPALDALTNEGDKDAYRAEHAFSKSFTDVLNNVQMHYGMYKATGDDVVTFQATASMQRELYALNCFGTETDTYKCREAYSEAAVRPEVQAELQELYDNLNFVGIKLGEVPKDNMHFPMLLVPIISFIMALLQTFISNRMMTQTNPEAAASMGPMKITMYIMPLMSLWIAFTVPAGAGFYWTISYVFGIAQTMVLNKVYNPAKLKEQALAEFNAQQEKNRTVNVEAVKVVNENGEEETLSQKEINRRKLAAARKADAEKYGEEYHETDDD